MQRHLIPVLLLILVVVPLAAEEDKQQDKSLLTVERIFSSDEFQAKSYTASWLKETGGYSRLKDSSVARGGSDIVLHDPADEEPQILVSAELFIPAGSDRPLAISDYKFSKNLAKVLIYTNTKRVWRTNTRGDYWVLDRSSRQLHQLGGDARPSTLMFAKFSPGGRQVAYVRQRNIYLEDLQDQTIRCLTETASSDVINGTSDWVYEEELRLRDGFRWSPDGQKIAYWQLNTRGVQRFPLINNTDRLYPKITEIPYPKVGQRNSACRIGVIDLASGETRWMNTPGDRRDNYLAKIYWTPDSKQLLIQQLNRLQNTNRLLVANASSGKVVELTAERDQAWVNVHDELHWLDEGRGFTWISERDGWRHVYRVDREDGTAHLLTPGAYDVIRLLHIDEPGGWMYISASPENATRRYLYRVPLTGGDPERLTPAQQGGTHSYQISPDARWAIHTHSTMDTPPRINLVKLPSHEQQRTLTDNSELQKRLNKLNRAATEFHRVEIGDGVALDSWCIKPPDLNAKRRYPLLVYVYGEPAGQTVLDRWSGSNYLWHLMLAQRGYVVMSFDNRGTPAPRGRAWRKCVYRQVGVLAPREQAAAVRKVIETRKYLDANRVGVWGWSGGGSMSLNAIFKFPELYHTAISIAPVPNQRYYDTIYQERYMGLPDDNVDGYIQGSPVNFAHQLEGNLLLIHGTGDDNCHYQTTEMLINELVRHNKPFSMMAYPNRSHSIREGKNTTRHMRELMTRYLETHLPAGPR
jgi:dipeptidyl-peptidase-4